MIPFQFASFLWPQQWGLFICADGIEVPEAVGARLGRLSELQLLVAVGRFRQSLLHLAKLGGVHCVFRSKRQQSIDLLLSLFYAFGEPKVRLEWDGAARLRFLNGLDPLKQRWQSVRIVT